MDSNEDSTSSKTRPSHQLATTTLGMVATGAERRYTPPTGMVADVAQW